MKTKLSFYIYFIFLFSLLFTMCKTNKDRVKEAEAVVKEFTRDLEAENYEGLKESYPSFSEIGRYYILYSFELDDSKISEDKAITIYGKYLYKSNYKRDVIFTLQENEKGKYFIKHTKGLSAFYKSNLYNFLQKVGCLNSSNSDAEIAKRCVERESFYNNIIKNTKENIEKIFTFTHTVKNSYGYVQGDMTLTNNSDFTIPSFSYEVYTLFANKNNDVLFKSKEVLAHGEMQSGGSITFRISEDYVSGMTKVVPMVVITNTDFIEEQILSSLKRDINCLDLDNAMFNVQK